LQHWPFFYGAFAQVRVVLAQVALAAHGNLDPVQDLGFPPVLRSQPIVLARQSCHRVDQNIYTGVV
jgi:hypothetical protein